MAGFPIYEQLADSPSQRLVMLVRHRLTPMTPMLEEWGWLPADAAAAARWMNQTAPGDDERRVCEARAVRALIAADIPVLVLKGALLAHTVYPSTAARLRGDLDVLIPEERREQAEQALRAIGMVKTWEVAGGPPMQQAQWVFAQKKGDFSVDLHWKLSNHPAVHSLFDFRELEQESQPIPTLCEGARGLSQHHALLHACIHYHAHHRNEFKPLQWVLDMSLLWRAMDDASRQRLKALSVAKGVASLAAAGLTMARDNFGTQVDEQVLADLRRAGRRETARKLLRSRRNRILRTVDRIAWERGLGARLAALRGTFFPPAAYMRQRFPEGSRFGLAGLYARRLLRHVPGRGRN